MPRLILVRHGQSQWNLENRFTGWWDVGLTAQGYAVIDQELEIGLCSIAVPVRNTRGMTIAAINVGAQAPRVTIAEMIERYLPAMQSTRDTIAAVLV